MKDCERCKNVAICKLEKPKDKCAFVNPFSESEDKPNCDDCAGCTSWLCDCANVRNKAVDDFVEKAMKDFTKFELEHGYPTIADVKVIIREVAEQIRNNDLEKERA